MTKCDFCVKSTPQGQCSLQGQLTLGVRPTKDDYCEMAIRQMVKAFGQMSNDEKRKF